MAGCASKMGRRSALAATQERDNHGDERELLSSWLVAWKKAEEKRLQEVAPL